MNQPHFLNDAEIRALIDRVQREPGARRDLADYVYHSEVVSRLSRREPGPLESETYLESFRARYRLAS
jgi:hypothetical protein